MLHFFHTILRNFTHNRLYTAINIVGLAIGLACFTFILLYIQDELSYDKYNKDYKRIYRIESDITISDRHQQVAKSSFAIGPTFKKEFPEIEEYVRFRSVDNNFLRFEDKQFYEDLLYFTDPSVFKVFNYKFILGSPENALTDINSIVLTQSLANKYFGEKNPLGKIVNLGNKIDCKVTGVIEDIPGNSHLKFDGLISIVSYSQIIGEKMYNDLSSIHFWAIRLFTYVKLRENTSIRTIHAKFPVFHDAYIAEISKRLNGTFNLLSTRLDKIHLYSNLDWDLPTGDYKTIYIFSLIAVIILIIASINYMNLATARSANKAKEIGIRKVLGAFKFKLARFLIAESIVLSFLAMIIAFVIVESFLPYINALYGKTLSFTLSQNPIAFLILFLVSITIGLFSGSYPALYLSSFRPVVVLKGSISSGRQSGRLRKILIVFQFAISIIMIIGTIIVSRQLKFIKQRDLGFKKENLLVIRSTDTSFKKKMDVFKTSLLKNPNIYNVATSTSIPGGSIYLDVFLVEGEERMEEQLISHMWVDHNYLDVMGMKIIKGRDFDRKFITDKENAALINWKTAEKLGWNADALGKKIHRRAKTVEEYKVIGVIEDFNYSPLYEEVGPIIFFLEKEPQDILTIRINSKNSEKTIAGISGLWSKFNPTEPFKYDYLDDILNEHYLADEKLEQIVKLFAILSVVISLLGLFGLSSFITEKASKNIGIRKLLGASVGSIIYLLSRDFLALILIAFVIATPIAWFSMDNWLQNFAYRVEISFIWFIITGLIVLLFALATVIIQTVKSALTNPVDVIRHE